MPRIIEVKWKSGFWINSMLSNLSFSPFSFHGVNCASTEGFWQGLKFPPDDERRTECFGLWGYEAKKMCEKATDRKTIFRLGDELVDVGSPRHLEIMREAIKAKILQNPRLLREFLDTGDAEFTHPVRSKRTSILTSERFCEMLRKTREELRGERQPQG